VLEENPAIKANLVKWVHLDPLVPKVIQELRELQVRMAHLDYAVHLDHQETYRQ